MLLTSLNYALSLGLGVTFLLGGLVAAALLHTFRNLAGIEIKPLAASDAFVGGHVVFSLAIVARRHRPRAAITVAAQRREHDGGDRCRVRADGDARSHRQPVARTRSRSAASRCRRRIRSDCGAAWAYVHFPLIGHRLSGAGTVTRRRCRPASRASTPRATGRGDDADLAGLREYQRGRSAAARRVEGGRARRRLVLEVVRRHRRRRSDRARLVAAAARARHRGASFAAVRVDACGGADDAAVRAVAARHEPADRVRAASIAARR